MEIIALILKLSQLKLQKIIIFSNITFLFKIKRKKYLARMKLNSNSLTSKPQKGFVQKYFSIDNLILFMRGVYYLCIWLYIQILILLFMLPFMRVSKPIQDMVSKKDDSSRNFFNKLFDPLKNIIFKSTKYLLSKLV